MAAIAELQAVSEALKASGIEDYGFEAELLLCHVLEITSSEMRLKNPDLSKKQRELLNELCLKRCGGYPLQYLLREWEFYGLPFSVGEGVLIPRPDTEILVDTALSFINEQKGLRIIDLCSGSGCIAVAIDKNAPNCSILALEKSSEAFNYLKHNIKLNHSDVIPILGDINAPFDEGWDLIVSNPPYITESEMNKLQKEVTYEPQMALLGGSDGLDFYRIICEKWAPLLKSGGHLLVEIGYSQAEAVQKLFSAAGLTDIRCIKDYGGNDRVIMGKKS